MLWKTHMYIKRDGDHLCWKSGLSLDTIHLWKNSILFNNSKNFTIFVAREQIYSLPGSKKLDNTLKVAYISVISIYTSWPYPIFFQLYSTQLRDVKTNLFTTDIRSTVTSIWANKSSNWKLDSKQETGFSIVSNWLLNTGYYYALVFSYFIIKLQQMNGKSP